MSRFGDWIDRKIDAASTCPECGCGYDRWVPNCTCILDDCSCSGAEERTDEEADEEPIRISWPTRRTDRPRDAERWYREVADLRADADAERDLDKARALRETADRLDRDPENPRNRSDHRGTSEDTRSAQPPQLTDAQVEHLSQAVDRAFAERDRMWDVYRGTGRAQDERAMEAQDRHAARLLDQYNAACQAQRAESDRRRTRLRRRSTCHPPAGPYQPPTKPSPSPNTPPPAAPTTSSPGAAMTSAVSYGSLKARLLGISGRLTDHQSPLQQALQGVEAEIAEVQATSEDSNHAGIQEALGHLMRAKESIEEAVGMVGAAQAGTEGAAAELS